jgi:ABC-type phosphate transport system substrate-binding protein
LGAPLSEDQEIVLIGNASVVDMLKAEEVKQIFLGKKTRWADNSNIYFVLFNDKDAYTAFVNNYIGKTYSQYRNYWKKQVFSGKGRMPKSFKQLNKLLEYLAETEGSVGFMPLQELEHDAVKILRIE